MKKVICLFAFAMLLGWFGVAHGEPITRADFEELHAELKPNADETWRSIPWTIDLLAAQNQAAETGKPLFVWAMDGHPLGCT